MLGCYVVFSPYSVEVEAIALNNIALRSYPAPFAGRMVQAAMAMQKEPSQWKLPVPLSCEKTG